MPKRSLILALMVCSTAHAAQTPVLLVQMLPREGAHLAQAASQILAEKTGRKVEDVSGIYYGLLPRFGMGVPESAPPGWPAALRSDFVQARQVCQARLGTPGAGREAQAALIAVAGCTDKMRTGLWTRYLRHRKADHLVEVTVQPQKGDAYMLSVSHTRPAADERRSSLSVVRKAELDATLTRVITALLEGEGQVQPARLDPELPAAPTGEVPAVAKAETTLPAVPVPCESGVPAAVVFDAKSALAETIAARWKRSVEGSAGRAGPAVECSLLASQERSQDAFVGEQEVLEVVASCGGKQHRAMTAMGLALRGRTAADVISERLLRSAFKSYCGAADAKGAGQLQP